MSGNRWHRLRDGLLDYEADHALSAKEEAAFARVRTVLGESGDAEATAIWHEWNAMPDGEMYAVRKIAAKLGLKEQTVAAVVYPEGMFGKWEVGDAG